MIVMVNPLEHFGIKSKFIRGDTSSYNWKVTSAICPHCGVDKNRSNTCRACGRDIRIFESPKSKRDYAKANKVEWD